MAKTLGQLCIEADQIIMAKHASAPPSRVADDYAQPSEKIGHLLSELNEAGTVKEASLQERLLMSLAMVDTMLNLPTLAKMAVLEKKASDAGVPEAQITDFFEKRAEDFRMTSIVDLIPWLTKG